MKRKMIINILFNVDPGWPNNPYKEARLTREWIEYRMDIFMKYTYQCLKKQTNKDFTAFIGYDPKSEAIIRDVLGQYEQLPENIIFTTNLYRDTINAIKGYDYLYFIRLDSDNMYSTTFIQQLHDWEHQDGIETIINQKGYVYHVPTDQVGTFYHESPSFFVFIYKVEDFIRGKGYVVEGGHLGVIKLKHVIFEADNFMIIIHEQNVSNKFIKGMYKELITDEEKIQQVKQQFGLI